MPYRLPATRAWSSSCTATPSNGARSASEPAAATASPYYPASPREKASQPAISPNSKTESRFTSNNSKRLTRSNHERSHRIPPQRRQTLHPRQAERRGAAGTESGHRQGRIRRADGTERIGQDHAPESDRRPGQADLGRNHRRRPASGPAEQRRPGALARR